MKNVLVDTSVWIDALNGKTKWQTTLLARLIDDNAAAYPFRQTFTVLLTVSYLQ